VVCIAHKAVLALMPRRHKSWQLAAAAVDNNSVLYCLQIAGEKEYYLATAFEELYIAPTANLRLAGFSVAGGVVSHDCLTGLEPSGG